MPERNLFVCFPESDGGHSYLAAREMLNPKSVAHLIFRNTVAESFEAVAAGQANFAVVPYYNSITQTDGATLKALASGQFEVFAQVCMPTSYVLVAHTDYIDEFLQTYTSVKDLGDDASPEDKAKIYTRFLTRIYVGAHADEQYRGRLIRPDLKNTTVELSRNPLRILEELSRSDQMLQMMKFGRVEQNSGTRGDRSGGSIQLGTTTRAIDTVQAPAALVAAGLLDAPGDPDGWDQPGSLGEIVSLLRKLLVLLNVYSFGAPDLPENTTQYLLIGRRGDTAPAKDALKLPATVTTRIMTMVRPSIRKSTADQWLKPFNDLSRVARQFGFVFDRAPVTVSSAKSAAFIYEGGKLKDGVGLSPTRWLDWLFGGESTGFTGGKDRTLRKMLEKKGSDKPDAPGSFNRYFLGEYPSWCYGVALKPGETSRCCDEPHDTVATEDVNAPFFQWVIGTLVTLTAVGLIGMLLYCPLTGACRNGLYGPDNMRVLPPAPSPSDTQIPAGPRNNADLPPAVAPQKPAQQPAVTPPSTYPGINQSEPAKSPVAPPQNNAYPGINNGPKPEPKATTPLTPAKPAVTAAEPARQVRPTPVFHVAFFHDKANLTSDTMNVLAAAASQVLQMERPAKIRVASLGPKEGDDVWRRRHLAIEDELVRQGVPRNQIKAERAGSQLFITIRPLKQPASPASGKRAALQLDTVGDPLVGEY